MDNESLKKKDPNEDVPEEPLIHEFVELIKKHEHLLKVFFFFTKMMFSSKIIAVIGDKWREKNRKSFKYGIERNPKQAKHRGISQ